MTEICSRLVGGTMEGPMAWRILLGGVRNERPNFWTSKHLSNFPFFPLCSPPFFSLFPLPFKIQLEDHFYNKSLPKHPSSLLPNSQAGLVMSPNSHNALYTPLLILSGFDVSSTYPSVAPPHRHPRQGLVHHQHSVNSVNASWGNRN